MFKQDLSMFHPSKYPTRLHSDGGSVFTISVPQLEMHPFVPGLAVPGAPVSMGDSVQKSLDVPH